MGSRRSAGSSSTGQTKKNKTFVGLYAICQCSSLALFLQKLGFPKAFLLIINYHSLSCHHCLYPGPTNLRSHPVPHIAISWGWGSNWAQAEECHPVHACISALLVCSGDCLVKELMRHVALLELRSRVHAAPPSCSSTHQIAISPPTVNPTVTPY